MLKIKYKKIFEKDVKRSKKRGYKIDTLKKIITLLAREIPLPIKYRDHVLQGDYSDHRECHIEPGWLLIYRKDKDTIIFVRTGTHSDLFKK